jgi:flagellar basal-body rod modification protein FlgD
MASPVSALLGSPTTGNGTAPTTTTPPGATPDKQMFLQLLVSQIKNQDPLNPVDGTQFVSQLAQFSQLEQLIAIRGDLDSQNTSAANSGAANGIPTDTANPAAPMTDPNAGASTTSAASGSATTQN